MSNELNPGSIEAVKQGCRCPVLDNSRGRGYLGIDGVFVTVGDCPLHGEAAMAVEEKLDELKRISDATTSTE